MMPEDWGGETIIMPVSAKTKEGIPELLDMILLVADVEELKADRNGPASGLVIESHLEQGRGPVAEALVEQGTLKPGDFLSVGSTYGKIRNLESTEGKPLSEAGPSTPVAMTGLKVLPDFGEEFTVVSSEKVARELAAKAGIIKKSSGNSAATTSSELLRIINRSNELTEFNIVVKADVQGSLTSVVDSLKGLDNEEVAVRIVSSGVGVINESDVHTASTSKAIIYGFHTTMPVNVKRLALRDKVSIRLYTVIYELIDDVKQELEKLLSPEVVQEELGELIIKGIFKITKNEVICGGEVTRGKLSVPALARIFRGKDLIADNLEIINLQRGPQDVKEVLEGEMCGLSFRSEKRVEVQENDRIELFTRETKTRTL
jgi:translation initiation factor IF-2